MRTSAIVVIMTCIPAAAIVPAAEYPVEPYVDPAQLEVDWPKHSHYKQPWRGFLETKSAHDFLQGIGINLNVGRNVELAAGLLAEAGFSASRIEIGWSSVNWSETGLNRREQLLQKLEACRRNDIRPTVLLNAHHGVPCPVRFFHRRLAADAAKGSEIVQLEDTADIVPEYTGLCNLTTYMAAQVFITQVDGDTGDCSLSKPLPKDLEAGENVLLGTLKYLPAHPVGTPQFEEMAQGWGRYVQLVLELIADAGIDEFDIEIWNELSFGSRFMGGHGINHYYEPDIVEFDADFLRPGGHAWEIGRRTIDIVHEAAPNARCIWGFSNTTFFHTPIGKLPPGTNGQSYHPYGTGTRELPEHEQAPDQPWRCLEGFIPHVQMRMPEGWAHTFVQTESLMRLLNPEARSRHPEKTDRFSHYITEHGVVPVECGVTDEGAAWDLKARCALRAFLFWLNKGIDVMHYYCAHSREPEGMGLLPPDVPDLPADAEFDDVATPPLTVMRRLTAALADCRPLGEVTQLEVVDVAALSEGRKVFEGDGEHPPLWERELLAVLPYQLARQRFAVGVYVMTYDYTDRMPEMEYAFTIDGVPDGVTAIGAYDPLEDRTYPVTVGDLGEGGLRIRMSVSDSPRLLQLGTQKP